MTPPAYKGKLFMYPCAGQDISAAVQAYGHLFDTFLFVDINYKFRLGVEPLILGWEFIPASWKLYGPPESRVRQVDGERRSHRFVEPAWLCLTYRNIETDRHVEVVQRRGFGQYALHELTDNSLHMFLHRGDSSGEGGSGTCFLSNRRMSHPPLSMLLNVLKSKLAYPALIGSDGSNTSVQELLNASAGDESIVKFTSNCMVWIRIGTLKSRKSNQTVIWRVTPEEMISATNANNVN
jgi:hypothetical protein